jgi:FAD/FMN-containing dehydrogenase
VAQVGVTWAKLNEALSTRGLRTPFYGPFAGLTATVGGSLSQNSVTWGTGVYEGFRRDAARRRSRARHRGDRPHRQPHGAAHLQIGKFYPYMRGRDPATAGLVRDLKRLVDPARRLNPGSLGL